MNKTKQKIKENQLTYSESEGIDSGMNIKKEPVRVFFYIKKIG